MTFFRLNYTIWQMHEFYINTLIRIIHQIHGVWNTEGYIFLFRMKIPSPPFINQQKTTKPPATHHWASKA